MIDRILLFPYSLTLSLKDYLYRKGFRKSVKADVPTICVGNITVGGTGKTPHTEMILRTLLHSDEWAFRNIAVLSRGYKRKSRGFQKVSREGTALLYGDEPVQIAKKFPGITVAVCRNRVKGARILSEDNAELILLDDAFQYRKLRADVNIVLVDYNRPIHKDMLLPFGHLRDLPGRVRDADIVIVTKCPPYLDEWERGKWATHLDMKNYNPATGKALSKDGKTQTLVFSGIGYDETTPVFEEADARYIYAPRLILFSGIAKDTPLRMFLSDKYKIVRRFSFPDHHRFSRGDIRAIASAAKENPTAVIMTTEKDAQRVLDVKKVPDAVKKRLFQIPIEVRFLTPEDRRIFEETLLALLGAGR